MLRKVWNARPWTHDRPAFLPYGMFDGDRGAADEAAAGKLQNLYHHGQERIWDGREVLAGLVAKHGGVQLPPEKIAALRRIFATIFWGELAAWQISAELAIALEPLEAKLAATSQAYDEARHFYVLRDYLKLLGYKPEPLPDSANAVLSRIFGAGSLAKKLIGMQLMVEPMALTLFHLVRASRVEPVLADLLAFYERDKARHVALGVHHLPAVLRPMSAPALAELYAWQLRMYSLQLDGVQALAPDLRALGFEPREVYRLGREKQVDVERQMMSQVRFGLPVVELFQRLADFRAELDFPPEGEGVPLRQRLSRAVRAVSRGAEATA